MRFPPVSRWIFVFIRKKTGEAGLFSQRVDKPRPCHSEPVTDVTGVGIRNLLAGNLRKSAGIMRFGNGLPPQCEHWLAMTGFFDSLFSIHFSLRPLQAHDRFYIRRAGEHVHGGGADGSVALLRE